MNLRNIVAVSGLALLAMAPFAANAGGQAKASNACIQAFVDSFLPKDSTVRVRNVVSPSGPLHFYARSYTLDLSAQSAGEELVSARCVANLSGEVLSLNNTSVMKGRVIPGVVAATK